MENVPNREHIEALFNAGVCIGVNTLLDPKLFNKIKAANTVEALYDFMVEQFGIEYTKLTSAERLCVITGVKRVFSLGL